MGTIHIRAPEHHLSTYDDDCCAGLGARGNEYVHSTSLNPLVTPGLGSASHTTLVVAFSITSQPLENVSNPSPRTNDAGLVTLLSHLSLISRIQ